MSSESPSVALVATGGTIANPPNVEGYVSGEEVVAAVPELDEVASVDVTNVEGKASSAFTVADWLAVHDGVERALDDDPDGVVVTQGSNTTEETAYLLHLTLDTDVPVAVTAAQRNFGTVGNDGNRNLLDAVRTVARPEAAGRGVTVVLNDGIHCARDVTKTVSGRPDAWSSGDFGPIGLVDKEGLVQFYRTPDRAHTTATPFDVPADPADFPAIEVVYSAVGIGGGAVEDAVSRGADGIVVAAYPTGSPSNADAGPSQGEALDVAAEEVPVVVSHRGQEGWPARRILEEGPLLWGDTLTPQKARILLALGLGVTDDRETLQEYFLAY